MESSSFSNYTLETKCYNDIILKYQNINNKLKKRFLRNPNLYEASEQFSNLVVQCEQEEFWEYAGLCCLAVSRCYQSLGITSSQINYLLKAGRYFLQVDSQNKSVGCPSLGRQHLQTASSCFNDALIQSQDNLGFNDVVGGAMIELALVTGANSFGEQLLKKSILILPKIQAINLLISYYIKQRDYTSALSTINELISLIDNVKSKLSDFISIILYKCEINRLFLILILQCGSKKYPPQFTEIIDKFLISENIGINVDENELILIQSLILACQNQNIPVLKQLEGQLWQYLTPDQIDLLRTLVRVTVND